MQAKDEKIIVVDMSDMKVATNPHKICSSGVGSCVVVTLYDSLKRIGALAHPMMAMPESGVEADEARGNLRFVESAIDSMISALEKMGSTREKLEAKIVGGASMFKVFDSNPHSMGIRNAEAAHKKLEKEGIKIVANDTGGSVGRSVVFDLITGSIEVKTRI
jgi:chemotaxis protein CheD